MSEVKSTNVSLWENLSFNFKKRFLTSFEMTIGYFFSNHLAQKKQLHSNISLLFYTLSPVFCPLDSVF